MLELSDLLKIQIETELYTYILLLIESQYNIEGVIDNNKTDSTKIIFKDKKAATKSVAQAIIRFAERNNVDSDAVKNYLLRIIENNLELNNEYKEAKEIILADKDEEER